jgi:hypothetical protein
LQLEETEKMKGELAAIEEALRRQQADKDKDRSLRLSSKLQDLTDQVWPFDGAVCCFGDGVVMF